MVKYKRTLGLEAGADIYRDDQQKSQWFDGIRGVEEELKITLATVQGEQPFAPDFGLDVFEATGATDPIIKREIRIALSSDDRVQSIDSIVIEQDQNEKRNRIAVVTVNVTLVNDESLQLNEVTI